MNDAAIIYRSHVEAIRNLPPEEQLQAYNAIIAYCMDDIMPDDMIGQYTVGMAKPLLDKWRSRREAGAKGGSKRKQAEATEKQTQPKVKVKVKVKDKTYNKGFEKPSVEEVRAYCIERGNSVDPEAFVAFYDSKGWKVGNSPMKSWKAAVITWEKRTKPSNRFQNFPQRTDQGHVDLVKKIIAMQ